MSCSQFIQKLLLYSSPLILLVGLIVTFVGYLNTSPSRAECEEDCIAKSQEIENNLGNSRMAGPILIGISVLLFVGGKSLSTISDSDRGRPRRYPQSVNHSSTGEGQSNEGYDVEFTSPPPPYREAIRMMKPAILHSSALELPSEPPPMYNEVSGVTSRSESTVHTPVLNTRRQIHTNSEDNEVILNVAAIIRAANQDNQETGPPSDEDPPNIPITEDEDNTTSPIHNEVSEVSSRRESTVHTPVLNTRRQIQTNSNDNEAVVNVSAITSDANQDNQETGSLSDEDHPDIPITEDEDVTPPIDISSSTNVQSGETTTTTTHLYVRDVS